MHTRAYVQDVGHKLKCVYSICDFFQIKLLYRIFFTSWHLQTVTCVSRAGIGGVWRARRRSPRRSTRNKTKATTVSITAWMTRLTPHGNLYHSPPLYLNDFVGLNSLLRPRPVFNFRSARTGNHRFRRSPAHPWSVALSAWPRSAALCKGNPWRPSTSPP